MNATVLEKTKERMVINWHCEKGYGLLTMVYDGQGGYNIDAEYMSIDTVISIIQAVKLTDNQ